MKEKKYLSVMVFLTAMIIIGLVLIIAIVAVIFKQVAHATDCHCQAKIHFEEETVVITYDDDSEELLRKENVPSDLWKRRISGKKAVRVTKGGFIGNEQLFIIEGVEGRWQCAFFATSYYR
jgi:hypothetical protein